ncbi:hypothetical protein HW555_001594 [Spodoptera exigua]|uniref:Cytochrome p450 n=1 Tax=Spodoptera exigua TaxID=7107 RepID=A0A835GTT2_SPOEX|nr:hypothetical protein HW555_001594 [Spodoptera exigua]
MIWQLFVSVVILYGLVLRWQARHRIKFAKLYKNDIKAAPILGHSVHFIKCKNNTDRWKVLEKFGREAVKQGGTTIGWNLHRLYFIVADPVVAECVMKHCLDKDDSMKLTLALIGNGSSVADVPIWRPRRKILVSTFSQKNLLAFTDIFAKNSDIMVQQLQKVAGTGSISISEYIMAYAMDSVRETSLGLNANSQLNPNQDLIKAFAGSCTLIADRIMKPWLHFEPLYKLTAHHAKYMEYVDTVLGYIMEMIQAKRKELAEKKFIKKNDEDKERIKSFLELMIESSGGDKGYTDKELLEEIMVIFTAGTDTSTLASSFASMLLARHPDVQEKVYQECKDVFGDSNLPVTAEELSRLKYMGAVIKETLRLYPPGPILLRKVDNDVVLPSGDTLPKGTGIFVSIFAANRNPRYWGDDADQFRPERFIDTQLKHPAAFLSFSYGPRNCLGYRYAMLSMKSVLSNIVRRFRILPVSQLELGKPLDINYDIMLRSADDYKVVLESRM